MPRSNPPRSSHAARLRSEAAESGPRADPPAAPPGRPFRRRLAIRFAGFMRWMHIYVSLFGLAAVLFFSVTGLTLNHPDWLFGGAHKTVESEGRLSPVWLETRAASPAGNDPDGDPSRGVARLEIVEHLRKSHLIRGALAEFRVDETECLVAFKGPGYSADAFVDRASGRYRLTETYHGFIAVINDLHKGRDTGKAWSVVIDVTAVLMTLISLSGLVLLFYLKLRRGPGLVVAFLGTAVIAAVVYFLVP